MRILIVSWSWPPVGRIGALRPMGMAREWVAGGHEVHVLTGPGDRGGEYSPDLAAAAEATGALVHRAPAPGVPGGDLKAAYEEREPDRIVRPTPRWRQVLGQWRGFPDLQRSWIRPAVNVGRRLLSQRRFDVLWSTSPPESAHFVARGLTASGPVWVADFRDQWSDYLLARWDFLSRWVIDRITARVLASAAAITANSEGVARSVSRASHKAVVCVRNGFDPVMLGGEAVRARTLGYFGRVDPIFQHPERLWAPLRRLQAEGKSWQLEFYLSPGGGGGAHIDIPSDLEDLVRVHPPVPHSEALHLMQLMTALLVLAWEQRGGEDTVAGKLFEYAGSGRPTLVCAPKGFEARRLVEAKGIGIGAWQDMELVAALRRLESFVPDTEGRKSLSRHDAALALEFVLARALGTRDA
jgi:hypothetical protein